MSSGRPRTRHEPTDNIGDGGKSSCCALLLPGPIIAPKGGVLSAEFSSPPIKSRALLRSLRREFQRERWAKATTGRSDVDAVWYDYAVWRACASEAPDPTAVSWLVRRVAEFAETVYRRRAGSHSSYGVDELVSAAWQEVESVLLLEASDGVHRYAPTEMPLRRWLRQRAEQAWWKMQAKALDTAFDSQVPLFLEEPGADTGNELADSDPLPEEVVIAQIAEEGRSLGRLSEWVDIGVLSEGEAAALAAASAHAAHCAEPLDVLRFGRALCGESSSPSAVRKRLNALRTRVWLSELTRGLDPVGVSGRVHTMAADGWLERPHGECAGQAALANGPSGWFGGPETRRRMLASGAATYGVHYRVNEVLTNVFAGLVFTSASMESAIAASMGRPDIAVWVGERLPAGFDPAVKRLAEDHFRRDPLEPLGVRPRYASTPPAQNASGDPPSCGTRYLSGVRDVDRLWALREALVQVSSSVGRLANREAGVPEDAVRALAGAESARAVRARLQDLDRRHPGIASSATMRRWVHSGRKSEILLQRLVNAAADVHPKIAVSAVLLADETPDATPEEILQLLALQAGGGSA